MFNWSDVLAFHSVWVGFMHSRYTSSVLFKTYVLGVDIEDRITSLYVTNIWWRSVGLEMGTYWLFSSVFHFLCELLSSLPSPCRVLMNCVILALLFYIFLRIVTLTELFDVFNYIWPPLMTWVVHHNPWKLSFNLILSLWPSSCQFVVLRDLIQCSNGFRWFRILVFLYMPWCLSVQYKAIFSHLWTFTSANCLNGIFVLLSVRFWALLLYFQKKE